jgi:SnoaL-like domain
MRTTARHPYRTAIEERDADRLTAVLHPDVVFDTPAFQEPIRGRENVLALFGVLATVFEDAVITDELRGACSRAITFRLRVDGHPIDGVDYLRLDGTGLVRRITVTMRPLGSLQVLADRMADTVGELSGQRQPQEGWGQDLRRSG